MRSWIQSRAVMFSAILILGVALRLVFILEFPVVQGDTRMYAEIARTWLHHGTFGMEDAGGVTPTYVRLPGYPAFLAAVFALFGDTPGMQPVMYVQLLFDLMTCLIIAFTSLKLFGERAAWAAFLLAALCPFTANYVALPLTETLSIFFSALAAMFAVLGLCDSTGRAGSWAGCGAAIGCATLLRPDGVLLLAAMGGFLAWRAVRAQQSLMYLRAGLVVAVAATMPLMPWMARNWYVFDEFQPLAPRYANAPGEFVGSGYNRWVRTWIADYVSVEDFFWKMPSEGEGETVDMGKMPDRAFDSPEQRAETAALVADFNSTLRITPQLDARFAALAADRIHQAPLRYYAWLPALRVADMWLRPRTEMLPLEVRWWEFGDVQESSAAIALGGLNLLLVGAAAFAGWKHRRLPAVTMLVTVILARSLFLGSLENPEPRYTLECYPAILLLAGTAVAGLSVRFRAVAHAELRAKVL